MMYRLREEGDYCRKGKCAVGSPKCDKCPCNFGARVKQEFFEDCIEEGGITFHAYYVKCTSWMGLELSKCVKDFINSWK